MIWKKLIFFLEIFKNQDNILGPQVERKIELDLDPETLATLFIYQIGSNDFYIVPLDRASHKGLFGNSISRVE